jgi:hypothetical protein
MLKDACVPQAPNVYWKHPKLHKELADSGLYIICSDDSRQSVRHSIQLATEIACTKKKNMPTHGVNPYTGINESAEYDALFDDKMGNAKVLYLNTLTTDYQLELELIAALPKMDHWLWMERHRGIQFPYEDLSISILSAPSGKIMKSETKKDLSYYIKDNNIDVVVLNSFEFASRTQREKDDMVAMLKELRDERMVAIVIYTHEPERRLTKGSARRGPIGALSMLANWVSTVEKLAPELCVPELVPEENTAEVSPEDGVCKLEESKFEGFDRAEISYQSAEEVQERLRTAPPELLPRRQVQPDGVIVSGLDYRKNGLGEVSKM